MKLSRFHLNLHFMWKLFSQITSVNQVNGNSRYLTFYLLNIFLYKFNEVWNHNSWKRNEYAFTDGLILLLKDSRHLIKPRSNGKINQTFTVDIFHGSAIHCQLKYTQGYISLINFNEMNRIPSHLLLGVDK